MHSLTISVSVLKNMAAKCSAVAGGASIMPILDYAKISVKGKTVLFQSTDLETSMQAEAQCTESSGEFVFLWSIKDLNDICSKLPETPVKIEYDESKYKIFMNTIAGEFEYQYESPEQFPAIPDDINGIQFEVGDGFIEKMKIASDFVSADTLRPSINGVLFDIRGGQLYLAATDMSSLYVSDAFFLFELDSEQNYQSIIPSKTIKKLVALGIEGSIEISMNKSFVSFKSEKISIYARLVDATYPNYRFIIPEYKNNFSVDLKAITQTISILLSVANNVTNQVEFKVEGNTLELKASDEGFSKRGKSPRMDVKNSGVPAFSFLLNGQTALKIFRNLRGNAMFYNDGHLDRAFIFKCNGSGDIYLLMPLMLTPKN